MFFRRRAPGRRGPANELIVCATCGADFVSPLEWREHDESNWWMRVRCGGCGEFREVVVSQEVANRYDRALDRTSGAIVATLARLDRERMTAEAEAFSTALRLDLFDAGDFAARRGGPGAARDR
jgi:DNA-directed RNA polymerase subunit RPC12/RpoP